MKIAFVFPGQGSQAVGMGQAVKDRFESAAKIYAEADSILGYSISALCFDGPMDELSKTRNTQPVIYTTSVATLSVLSEHGIVPGIVAGHSVGEYAAVVASKAMDWQSGLKLVAQRAAEMERAANSNPGTMSAVLGLDYNSVLAVCKECEVGGKGIVDCANVNSDSQIVISGEKAAVEAASALATERGAKRVVPLTVSGAFHSRLMRSAADAMSSVIESSAISDTPIPIVANVTADIERTSKEIKTNLTKQIDHSVLWDQSVKRMLADGVDTFVEVGAGKILAGLLKRVSGEITIYTTGDEASLSETLAALGKK